MFLTSGAGFGSRTVYERLPCEFPFCSKGYAPIAPQNGLSLHLAVGMAFHIGPVELGPVIRADRVPGANMITVNFAVGGAMTKEPD